MSTVARRIAALIVIAAALVAGPIASARQIQQASDNYDELFQRYLAVARGAQPSREADIAWMSGLMLDHRARAVNDIVTVRVVENIVATGSADSTLAKKGTASAGVTQLFGAQTKVPSWLDMGNLVGAGSNTDFKGGGATTRSSTLTALMTVRVAEVLPNGDLVLEGAREIDVNGDRQMVVLTGVVRGTDITPNNVILSTQVAQLRIRYFGRGLIKDNLQPGWLIRILNKIF
jgi:flagellar L-ring protein FlgH